MCSARIERKTFLNLIWVHVKCLIFKMSKNSVSDFRNINEICCLFVCVSDLQQHHAGLMNQSDALKDPDGDLLRSLHLLHIS